MVTNGVLYNNHVFDHVLGCLRSGDSWQDVEKNEEHGPVHNQAMYSIYYVCLVFYWTSIKLKVYCRESNKQCQTNKQMFLKEQTNCTQPNKLSHNRSPCEP